MIAYRQNPPTEKEAQVARDSMRLLAHHVHQGKTLTVKVIDGEEEQTIALPAGAVSLLMDILGAMASGQGVTLIPENAELTTVQAAEILNVSRPFLIKLLEEKEIPFRKVGSHRRVRMEDIMNYKQKLDREREEILEQLVAAAQELDMGYD
jgi:excisionase family DNA binding protein